jgi:hypothetical protein
VAFVTEHAAAARLDFHKRDGRFAIWDALGSNPRGRPGDRRQTHGKRKSSLPAALLV